VLVAAVSVVCFLPTLRNGFVWDDRGMFLDNPEFRGLTLAHLRWMFTTFHMGHYQPLSWVTLGADFLLWGLNPAGFHLTNLVLHAVNAVLVCLLIRALLRAAGAPSRTDHCVPIACAVGALFFAVHPLRVESVAWVTERRDVLSGLFLLLTVLAYLRMADAAGRARARWCAVSLICFALSLLSKAWGITLPAVLLILDAHPLRRVGPDEAGRTAPAWRRLILEKAPFILLSAACAALAFLAQKRHAMDMVAGHSVVDRLMQAGFGLGFYVCKTLVPIRLSPLYLLKPSFNPWEARCVACVLIAAGLTAWLTVRRRRWPWALTAWLCYVAIVSPVLGLAQSGQQLAADRYTYLACLPFAVLVGAGLSRLRLACATRRERAGARLAVAVAAGLLGVLSLLTLRQIRVWCDSHTLWDHAVRLDPENAVALHNRGNARKEAGDLEGAFADYTIALGLDPTNATSYCNRGSTRQDLADLAGARADYDAAIKLDPKYVKAYNNRGTLRAQQGDLRGALADYDQALRLDPACVEAYMNRGSNRVERGDAAGALADYAAAIRLDPSRAEAYVNRGAVRRACGDLAGAREDYDAAIALDPENAPGFFNRGNLRRDRGDLAGALADFSAAIRLDPTHVMAHNNRGNLRHGQGDLAGALADFTAAIRLAPASPIAYNNRGNVHKTRQDLAAALTDYDMAVRFNPGYVEGYVNRGAVRRRLKDLRGAGRDFRKALELAPANWPYRARIEKQLARAEAGLAAGRGEKPEAP